MAARYVRIGQHPDYRDEIRGTLAEILASTANPGTYAAPEDVTGTFLEMGSDGLWTGASVGYLTKAQADAIKAAQGVKATLKVGVPAQVDGGPVTWRGADVGWAKWPNQTTGFQDDTFPSFLAKNILLVSESILGSGNFPSQLAEKTGAIISQSIRGGSEIPVAALDVGTIRTPMIGGNIIPNSNLLTGSGWAKSANITLGPANAIGRKWWDVAKTSTSTSQYIEFSGTVIPATKDNLFISFDIFMPDSSYQLENSRIEIRYGGVALGSVQYYSIESGSVQKITLLVDANNLSAATVGSAFVLRFYFNYGLASTSRVLVSNFHAQWNIPGIFENYVPTEGSAAASGSSVLREVAGHDYLGMFDAAYISFGRNDANDWTSPKSFARMYYSVISALSKRVPKVIAGTPPPKNDGGLFSPSTDNFLTRGHREELNKVIMRSGNFFADSWRRMQDYSAADVMNDSWHQNDAGSSIIADLYIEAMDSSAGCIPCDDEMLLYPTPSAKTGTWTNAANTWYTSRLRGKMSVTSAMPSGIAVGAVNTTVSGSTITFDIDKEVTDIGIIFSGISVTGNLPVDVALSTGEKFSTTLPVAPSSVRGVHIASNIVRGARSVTITINSSGGVSILGVCAV